MVDWNFSPEHPIVLTLAADARLGPTSYIDDQIWELNSGNSEPPALCIQTTFGLRARMYRIFPRFIQNGQVISDPVSFSRPIIIHKYFPNYLSLSFRPFSSINVNIEYWVPSSQVVAARTRIANLSHETRHVELEWAAMLIPSPEGSRMSHKKIGFTTILAGETANLFPVLFLTGGVQPGIGPYPSLQLSIDLPAQSEQEARWVNASLADMQTSFEMTKEIISKNWEAEVVRIQRIQAQHLEIITGNHDWNTAFFLSETIASQLFLHPIIEGQSPSFVYSRQPDQGFSIRNDGSDYNHLWNGQTAFDTYYLTNFLLPHSPETLRGLLDNFFVTQTATGDIDWKPGMGGQRSQLMSTPLLATVTWIYYQYTEDKDYLKVVYPRLKHFFFAWCTASHDRDGDCIPEWDQAIQTGFEEHPLCSNIQPWCTGLDITTIESPDLIAYLYRESQSLGFIARLVGDADVESQLITINNILKNALDQSWSDDQACYLYRDRDSHITSQAVPLGIQLGPGRLEIQQEFQQPVRPLLVIHSKKERTQPVQIYIHGRSPSGAHRVEQIQTQGIHWNLGSGFATSSYLYKSIEQIEVSGILEDVEVVAHSADLAIMDLTLLQPLWAGIPSEEKAHVLINLAIYNKKRFLSPYGLRSVIIEPNEADFPEDYFAMHLPWISLALEGILNYSMQQKAADIFTRWMKLVVQTIKQSPQFRQSYHSENGKPMGAVNSLSSLVPVGLFLKILGVSILNPNKIIITHSNPFSWPVTIKYCGLTVVHHSKSTLLVFPNGQNITVNNDHPQTVCVEPD